MRPRFLSALSFACAAMLLTHDADARSRARVALAPTAADANASGRARLSIKSPSDGQFEVKIRRLDPNTTYQLIVGGVHVGDITTTGGGNGKVRFRSRPRNDRDLPLGFDPQNATIVVRSAAGVDVLTASFPDANPGNDDDVVCCIPDDSGPECEDRTPDECAAQGGTVVAGATSCLPNPCDGAAPVDPDIVCCLPDDSGPECEDRTQAECLAGGGVVVSATSCVSNPCAAIPPADPDVVCCLPDNGGDGAAECEDRTADACIAAGGTVSSATSCTPDPCGGTAGGSVDDHGGNSGSGSSGSGGSGGSGGGADDPAGHS